MMRKNINIISEYFQISLGVLLASIGLKAFLLPNGFLDGGATGIAILISEFTKFDISYLLLLISAPFLFLGWFTLSKKSIAKSILAIVAVSFLIHYENFEIATDDKLLISIFGGLFLGAGIGLAVKNGAVLDGSEILGLYLNNKFGISIGRVVLFFNTILFIVTAVVLSKEVAMYSILTYLVTARVIDLMIKGFEDFVGLMIISEKPQDLELGLLKRVGTGITVYQGKRGYGSRGKTKDVEVIHMVINRIDIRKTHNAIDEIDPSAFIIEFDVNHVKGGVLRKYLNLRSQRKLSKDLFKVELMN